MTDDVATVLADAIHGADCRPGCRGGESCAYWYRLHSPDGPDDFVPGVLAALAAAGYAVVRLPACTCTWTMSRREPSCEKHGDKSTYWERTKERVAELAKEHGLTEATP